jgi:peptidoglycan/LPS O-acetylase OafA/YrhL
MESVAKVNSPRSSSGIGGHIPALDGVRALAILLVIPHNLDTLNITHPGVIFPLVLLMHAGWIGVQLFFVLSGFLITGNLLDAQGADNYFSAFFGRRALRILPLYYTVLLVAFVIAPLLVAVPEQMRLTESHQVSLWTFVTNWTEPYDGGVYGFGHFWSLAVEEQFYLIWPFIVARCRPETLLRVCAAAVVISLLARCAMVATHFSPDTLYMFTICRMDALALGAGAAALIRIPQAYERLCKNALRIAAAAVVCLIVTAVVTRGFGMHEVGSQTVGYSVLSLTFTLGILLTVLPARGALGMLMEVLSSKPLRLIGRYSYGMYVLHLPLHVFFTGPLFHRLAPHPTAAESFAYAAIMTGVSFALAALSYELFERRFLKLKNKLTPTWNAYTPGPA